MCCIIMGYTAVKCRRRIRHQGWRGKYFVGFPEKGIVEKSLDVDDIDVLDGDAKYGTSKDISGIVLVVADPRQGGEEGKDEACELAEGDEETPLGAVHSDKAGLEVEDYPGHSLK